METILIYGKTGPQTSDAEAKVSLNPFYIMETILIINELEQLKKIYHATS